MITGRTIISRSYLTWSGTNARRRLAIAIILLITSISALGLFRHSHRWRTWNSDDVPVAFWAWHSECPGEHDVRRAVKEARAQTLFLRAGQIDFEGAKLRRIRAVTGRFPTNIDIHFVYNATRSCLAELERLSPTDLATVICRAYEEDATRAARDHARVAGLQLDIDVPTRLLPSYTKLLKTTREMLPASAKLSITGLPTWMESPALRDTLAAVDFWIPQCYGATIPETLSQSQSQPVSSLKPIAAAIARARLLNRPYYAGVAAYGYAIQYARDGSLIALRGDLDPALVANDSNLELISRGPFEQSGEPALASGWRCLYRARNDGVIDGTAVHAVDYLMLDIPTSASLREAARIAREQGGDQLLGLCVFRLPRQDDPTTLTIKEVASALAGEGPFPSFHIEAKLERELEAGAGVVSSRVRLRLVNDGAAGSLPDDGAMSLILPVPDGSVRSLSSNGFASAESQREEFELGNEATLRPCSLRRASVLTLSAKTWRPGQQATAVIEFAGEAPETLRAMLTVTLDDGRVLNEQRTMKPRTR
jgi:hypothetical protein